MQRVLFARIFEKVIENFLFSNKYGIKGGIFEIIEVIRVIFSELYRNISCFWRALINRFTEEGLGKENN